MDMLGWEFKKSSSSKKINAPYIQRENDDASFVIGSGYYGHTAYHLSFDQNFESENDLILKYREMALMPEIDEAITDIVNEAIASDTDSSPVEIILDDLNTSDKIKDNIRDEFEYILKLLNFNTEGHQIFRKWYVDGRINYYIVADNESAKNKGIKELIYLSPLRVRKIREEVRKVGPHGVPIVDEVKEYFLYTPTEGIGDKRKANTVGMKLTKDSVCYVNSGLIDDVDGRVFSYLHKAIKPANQLRMIEDATLIYRLSRAPERRAFYVDVGNLPKGQAEEYLRGIMNRYKNKMVYDANTGEVKDSTNFMSMVEDYWLPRREGGKGTEISTLPGGQNLGELDDVEYFKRKLYMALNVPYSRISPDGPNAFTIGRASEITRDEIKYSKFIARLRKRFSNLFYELLRTQLILKQIIKENEWENVEENIAFDFISDVFFKELKEAEILRERVNLFNELQPLIGTYYSQEWVRKNILMQSDEDIEQMKKQIESEEPIDTGEDETGESEPTTDTESQDDEDSVEATERKRIKDENS